MIGNVPRRIGDRGARRRDARGGNQRRERRTSMMREARCGGTGHVCSARRTPEVSQLRCIDRRAGNCGETCRVRAKLGPLRAPGNGELFISVIRPDRERGSGLRLEGRGGTRCGRRSRENSEKLPSREMQAVVGGPRCGRRSDAKPPSREMGGRLSLPFAGVGKHFSAMEQCGTSSRAQANRALSLSQRMPVASCQRVDVLRDANDRREHKPHGSQ